MDIPPLIRVTLNVVENRVVPGALARFARVGETTKGQREGLSSQERGGHTEACITTARYKPLDSLLTLGINDTVTFIKGLADPPNEAADDRICVERNVTILSAWESCHSGTRIRTKDARVLRNRIGSILDLLSLQDTAKLMYAISHLDSSFRGLGKLVVEHFVQRLSNITVSANQAPDIITSLALALTSVELLLRTSPEQQRRNDSGGISSPSQHDQMPGTEEKTGCIKDFAELTNPQACERSVTAFKDHFTIHEMGKHEDAIAIKIGKSIEISDCIDPGLLLLLTQVIANISLPAADVANIIIRKVCIDELNEEQLCKFIHACAMAINVHQTRFDDIIEKCMAKLGSCTAENTVALHGSDISRAFHAFYLTGKIDPELMGNLAKNMASNRMTFTNAIDFYRTTIPLAIAGHLSSETVCLWVLNQVASNVDLYSKLTTHFLFLLTSIANNVKVVWKKRGTLPLRAVALETDIYEKAETFLRQQEGEKTYFSSPRAAMLFLIERANENIKTSSADEFVQLLLLNCARNFKPDSRIKFELLNECKRRVREIPCSGIPQVLQTLFTLFSPNAPELVEAFALYLDRITTEMTIYNRGRAIPAEGYTSPVLTFLEDVNLLGNILATLDRCNLNRADLAVQVVEMFERHNYKQLEKANFQGLIDVLHYLAFSLDQHDAIDVVAIVIQQRLEEGVDASAGQLAAISECFIAAPLALNPLRHQALIHAIRHRANESKGNKKVLEDILDKLS